MPAQTQSPVICNDALDRPLKDIRISVTDRCNFRCLYCMPKQVFGHDFQFIPHEQVLRFEEIVRVAKCFAALGGEKIRLTGGEPLLRRHIEDLVFALSQIKNVHSEPLDLTLTTNGTLLAQKAQALYDAGLKRITVSLDAIDATIFQKMTDSNVTVDTILSGIDEAIRVGFHPIKINTVIRKNNNTSQILPLIAHFKDKPVTVRFIEYMDVGTTNETAMRDVYPAKDILKTISEKYDISPLPAQYRGETAKRWCFNETGQEFGIISSMSEPFCADCTRLRLSAEGQCYTCLFATQGFDLRALLRQDTNDEAISQALQALWHQRTNQYSVLRQQNKTASAEQKIQMFYIGG